MAAVFRLKRRCEEEPLQALVLTYKRRKQNDGGVAEDSNPYAVIKLAGTAKSQDEDVGSIIPREIDKEAWKSMHEHKVDVLKKVRADRKESSKNNRLKVVNFFRHIENFENTEEVEGSNQREVVVFDLESEGSKVKKETVKDGDDNYVYDIYYGQKVPECDYNSEDLDIVPYLEEVDLGFRLVSTEDDEEDDDEEEDSNDENNWRNDYPDSDHSIDEEDMQLAIQMDNVHLGGSDSDQNELSSDDEALIHEIEADPFDVEHYGEKYARYKARMQRELSEDEVSGSDREGSYGSVDEDDEDPVSRFL